MITGDDVIIERKNTYSKRTRQFIIKLKNGEIIAHAAGVKEPSKWNFLFNPSRTSAFTTESKFYFIIKKKLSIGRVRDNILTIMNYPGFKRELIKKVFEET